MAHAILTMCAVFALCYSVLLWSVSTSEFSPNSFLSEIHREIVREVLLAAILLKTTYMSTDGFFDFALEFLEVSEHFALIPHRIDLGVLGEVVDEEHVILASTECCCLCRSPYIGMDYVE